MGTLGSGSASMTRKLREVMRQPVLTVGPDLPVCECAQKMAVSRVGCVLVMDAQSKLVGVFTERDLLRMFTTRLDPPLGEPVGEHMSRYPLTLDVDAPLDTARDFMRQNQIRHLPVVEGGLLVGLVSVRDLLAG
jgi:CBS domain-containing protein